MDQPIPNTDTDDNEEPEWFNDFLSDYDFQTPKPGQLLEGTILSIENDGILVDIGVKRDAIVPAKDLTQIEESKIAQLKIGDKVFVYVLNRPVGDRELLVSLSKGIEHESWERAESYLNDGTALNLEIVSHNRGGLIVEFETLRGFLPYSQVPGLRGIRNPRIAERLKKELVSTSMEMKVIEVVRDRNRLIVSATAAEKEKRQTRLEELNKGDIITGKVVNIVEFGIFVDLDGIDGLVHLSELTWQRIKHPSEVNKVEDEIEVKVLDVDVDRERVSLSRKALLPSPWEFPDELPKDGDCIEGIIVKVVNFGAFVELPIGIEGLVHTSQLGYTHSENPTESVKRGETVLVRVLDVNPDRRRISLSMRQVPREVQIAWAMDNFDSDEIEDAGQAKPEEQQTQQGKSSDDPSDQELPPSDGIETSQEELPFVQEELQTDEQEEDTDTKQSESQATGASEKGKDEGEGDTEAEQPHQVITSDETTDQELPPSDEIESSQEELPNIQEELQADQQEKDADSEQSEPQQTGAAEENEESETQNDEAPSIQQEEIVSENDASNEGDEANTDQEDDDPSEANSEVDDKI